MKIELLKSQNIPLSKLETNKGQIDGLPKNPRLIKTEKFEKLKKSIEDNPEMLGMREVLVYPLNAKFIIIGGNMRYQACKELGFTEVPCKILDKDTTAEQLRAITIKDNVGFGEHDWDLLANEWDSIELEEWGLDVPNFETEETILEAEEDDYEEPENLKVDVVLGDLIEFECTDGRVHRLICGDSTDSDTVAKLMNGEKADMVFTDPPYGISHSGKGIKGSAKENDFGEILGDNDVTVAIDAFNLCQSLFSDATMIFWGANYYSSCLPNGFGWLVWDKQREGNTFSGAELAFVNKGVKLDVFRHQWHGMIKGSEMGEKRVHPTQKPIALIEWSFINYKAQDKILDLFLGSGSTMAASHKTSRKCYGMELDPKYCQVIIDRMQKLDSSIKVKINSKEYANT
jgi:16S rRNA G966 N2-methylase RsmD